jgi:hypothetical protein
VKGRTLKWVVDSDKFSLCKLISGLKEEVSWGICQTPKTWFFEKKNESRDVELLFESQIPKIFRMYISERKITLLVVLCDLDESSNQTFLCTPSQMPPPIALGS